MSLYNAIFGYQPTARVGLVILGVDPSKIPRFRDCWIEIDDLDNARIAIYTRTGGGNRGEYENTTEGPSNADLRKLPGFVEDVDDTFDPTYAIFYYTVPPVFVPLLKESGLGKVELPAERWKKMLAEMEGGGAGTPESKRALEVGTQIFSQLEEVLKRG